MPRAPAATASSRSIATRVSPGNGASREQFEGERLKRVAGEDRGGFVERDMHGRLAAAQAVVVHRRQVVVHQRVGMDQFDCGRGRIEGHRVGAECGAGRVHQQRTHALAAIERGVAHRGVQALR